MPRLNAFVSTVAPKAWQLVDRQKASVSLPPGDWNAVLQTLVARVDIAAHILPEEREKIAGELGPLLAASLKALCKFGGMTQAEARREMKSYVYWQEQANRSDAMAGKFRIPAVHPARGLPVAERLHAELSLAAQNGIAALRDQEKGNQKEALHHAHLMAATLFLTLEDDLQGRHEKPSPHRLGKKLAAVFRDVPRREHQPTAPPSYYPMPKPVRIPAATR